MELSDLLPDGIPYPDAPPEAREWVNQRLAKLICTPDGGVIMITHRGRALIEPAPEASADAEGDDEGDDEATDDPAAADTAVLDAPPQLPPLDAAADSTDNLEPFVPAED